MDPSVAELKYFTYLRLIILRVIIL